MEIDMKLIKPFQNVIIMVVLLGMIAGGAWATIASTHDVNENPLIRKQIEMTGYISIAISGSLLLLFVRWLYIQYSNGI
jgi:hypothetical protein